MMIIDCRYDYEFKGGHIKGALNLNSQEEIQNLFLASKEIVRANTQQRTLVIFHCEFSQRRGPKMYSVLRGLDRQLNTEVYPKLFYPEIYILEGGYSKFTKLYPEHCVGGYIQQDFERDQKSDQPCILHKQMFSCNKKMRFQGMKIKGITSKMVENQTCYDAHH